MPFGCAHLGQEALHLLLFGNDRAVEVSRIPIDQDTTYIKDNGPNLEAFDSSA